MPELPRRFVVGRGAMTGPVAGTPMSICFGAFRLTAGGTGTNDVWGGIIMPVAFRITQVCWAAQAAVTANVDFSVYKHASAFTVAGATNLLSGVVALDADENNFAFPVGGGTGVSLTAAARNVSRGDRLFLGVTFDATGAIPDMGFSVVVNGFTTGVVAKEDAYD